MRLKTPDFHENAATSGGAAIPTSGVQIFIPAALNRPTHTLYSICTAVQPTLQEWTVNRRYSQFLQLRDDILVALTSRSAGPGCPGCASFALALRQFAFPRKSWIRTNRVVRKRVKSLQQFLLLLVERLYNDLPKCNVCGDQVKKMVRPFLIRGAQPIGDSTLSKIQYSLSLHSYAIVKHQPRKDLSASAVSHNAYSYVPTERTDSDPALTDAPSPSVAKVDFASSTISEDSYGKQFGDERCTDTPVALEEALKQIVVIDKRKNTVEDMVTRLSSMWDGYDAEKAPKEIDLSRLSFTQEESTDGEPEFLDDDDDIGMLEENDVSLALLGGNDVFGLDDDEREARPLPVDEVAL